jgi:Uma2 family endonuclease
MTPVTTPPATFDDLMKFDGKAELIHGRIVPIMATGYLPGKVARKITRSLEDFAAVFGRGEPIMDSVGFTFSSPLPSGRQSLSPDTSYYLGPLPTNLMKYITGFPVFAVEVRSESDYGSKKDREYDLKRKDYFFAGTEVVWDVDPVGQTVTVYRASDPTTPVVFRRGDVAEAEPALPGWRLNVDDLFS